MNEHLTSSNVKRHLRVFGVLVLIGAAINLPLATQFIKSRLGSPKRPTVTWTGVEAAKRGWPTTTPHSMPWPPPDLLNQCDAFGFRSIRGWQNSEIMSMDFELIGWPFPVFERVHWWCYSEDPKWKTSAEPDPAMKLHWSGVIGNPLAFAVVIWLVLLGLPALLREIRRRRRVRNNRCPDCGYPMGSSDRCSECGAVLPAGRNVPTPSAA